MTDEQWPRVKALFQSAADRPAAERDAFLCELTGEDAALRDEVESLLAADAADTFLEALPVAAHSMLDQALTSGPPLLTAGLRVGRYEILGPLGSGAMGEVYRASDTHLNRDVALKVLPEDSALDRDRLTRFKREAQLLATLNHPNIAAIYGFEESNGVQALALELVDGSTLADRLATGALPLEESLNIARKVAEGLEAAHAKGIIHRDVKPANIKIASDGAVKVLDFGLAKVWDRAPHTDASGSPRLTSTDFADRTMMGTPAYMSPEQARCKPLDRRTDIWSFGCVMYEMLTLRAPFARETISDTLAAILDHDPDWSALPITTPAPIHRLLRRCLEKDRTRRLADIADARLEIDDALNGRHIDTDAPVHTRAARRPARFMLAGGLLLVGAAAGAIAAWTTRPNPALPITTRTLVSAAFTHQLSGNSPEQRGEAAGPNRTAVALSPDGRTLVFAALVAGERQLHARRMDELEATPISGTIGAHSPFFSPDGQWVGFGAAGELRKVRLSGGPPVTLCKAASLFGASWGSDGTIIFVTARNGGLLRVSDSGGTAEPLTTKQPGEYSHRLPHILPGSRAVIFTISKGAHRWDDTQVVIRSLETGTQTVLVEGGADGRYISTGHILYVRLGTLMAVPFDPVRLAVTGGATGLIDGVMQAANFNLSDMDNSLAAQFTISDTGALVYVTGGVVPATQRSLAWVDRHGTIEALSAPLRAYRTPRLSPDGRHVAAYIEDNMRQVWSYDIARGALSALTADGRSGYAIFAPDQKRIAFRSSAAGGEDNLYWTMADGSGAVQRLTTSTRSQTPVSWSPDGKTLTFVEEGDSVGETQVFQFDIRELSVADRTPRALISTAANETSPEFSPDGRWLAYVSNQSGRHEVYVQPYPGPGERHLISTSGGNQPAWSRDGRELFYVQPPSPSQRMTLMSVATATTPTFRAGAPRALFASSDLASAWGRHYDVTPDGQRFLMAVNTQPPANRAPPQMIYVHNWFDEVNRLVPAK